MQAQFQPAVHPEYKHAPDGSTMQALAWFGKTDVRMVEVPVPDITEPDDVIVKVTGTTICGSDLHLYHNEIPTLQKGDVLGHEFMGVVDKVGPNVQNLRPGQRVVASFQIACGECDYCKQKLSSFCDRTNSSSMQDKFWGQRDAAFFGYSHMAGDFPGGQAEYVRVPKGNVNLLPIPDGVPDEKAIYLSDTLPTSSATGLIPARAMQDKFWGQRDAAFFGYSHMAGDFPGGQAEYVRVPKGNVNLLPIPDGVPDEKAIYLSDTLPTSYHAVVDTGVEKGDVVGIWGLGPIGMCAAKWALLKGASRVIGIDKVPERLAFARDKLGIEVIDFTKFTDVPKRLYELVPRGLDVALDCGTFHEPKTWVHKLQRLAMLETDSPETLNEMLLATRKRGKCGLIAVYSATANGVNLGALMEKGIRLIGNGQAPVHLYWKEILEEYIIPGKFDPTFIISHRVLLEDMAKLYEAFDKRQDGVEKVFVETKFSAPPAPGCPKTTRVEEWAAIN